MYASFLLKYSKSYLHTCIIFYMFILFFFFLQCHTRGRVISLSRIGIHPHPPPTLLTRFCFSKRFVTLAPFSPSFSLSIGDFYLSLVLLGTDHQWWTQWGTPARPGSEKEKKNEKKRRRKRVPRKPLGTDTSGFECICMYAYVCWVCVFI